MLPKKIPSLRTELRAITASTMSEEELSRLGEMRIGERSRNAYLKTVYPAGFTSTKPKIPSFRGIVLDVPPRSPAPKKVDETPEEKTTTTTTTTVSYRRFSPRLPALEDVVSEPQRLEVPVVQEMLRPPTTDGLRVTTPTTDGRPGSSERVPQRRETVPDGIPLPGSESAASLSMEATASLYLDHYSHLEEECQRTPIQSALVFDEDDETTVDEPKKKIIVNRSLRVPDSRYNVGEAVLVHVVLCDQAQWRRLPSTATTTWTFLVSSRLRDILATVARDVLGEETTLDDDDFKGSLQFRGVLKWHRPYPRRGSQRQRPQHQVVGFITDLTTDTAWRRAAKAALRDGGGHMTLYLNVDALRRLVSKPPAEDPLPTTPSDDFLVVPCPRSRVVTLEDLARGNNKKKIPPGSVPVGLPPTLKARRLTIAEELQRRFTASRSDSILTTR